MTRILALLLIAAGPASATNTCGTHDEVAKYLTGQHQQLRFTGVDDSGYAVELWVGVRGAYTLTVTMPGGLTCISRTGRSGDVLPAGVLG